MAGDQRLSADQQRYGRDRAEVADWQRDEVLGGIPLAEVVRRVHPTVLIGTSARGGAFTEDIVKDMAAHADRPVIMPMSNPTELAEARPSDLIEWTGGRALVATGSPFPPVEYRGTRYVIGQANNALVFPGLGLGAIAARASRITDDMLSAAAHAVAAAGGRQRARHPAAARGVGVARHLARGGGGRRRGGRGRRRGRPRACRRPGSPGARADVAARLPAGPAGLIRAAPLPGNRLARPGPAARRAGRRLLSDLRGGRAFLAAELSQSGWLDFGAFRWQDLASRPGRAGAIGVMAPLIIGVATGKIEYGSYAALGALPAGFVSFRGVSRTRVLAVLAAAAGMAVSTFVGATAAWSQPWLLVPVVFVWAYATGLLASLGPTVLTCHCSGRSRC